MKILCVITLLIFMNSCGSNPKIAIKNTVFDNSLNRETVIQLSADYLLSRGLAPEYEAEPEEITEYDEYWAVIFRKKVLTTDALSVKSPVNTTRLVLKINKQNKKITEENIK